MDERLNGPACACLKVWSIALQPLPGPSQNVPFNVPNLGFPESITAASYY